MNNKIYFCNITRRWKAEASEAVDGVTILSPYITSTTAETVLDSAPSPENCEVYTDFSPWNFVNGSSSIRTLKKLAEKGYTLFHLPQLHAKVFLSKGRFASIGSQNLTTRGRCNREATTCHEAPGEVSYITRRINEWAKLRHPITLDMIEDMLELLPPLERHYQELSESMHDVETELERRIKTRKCAEEDEAGRRMQAAEDEWRNLLEEEEQQEKVDSLTEEYEEEGDLLVEEDGGGEAGQHIPEERTPRHRFKMEMLQKSVGLAPRAHRSVLCCVKTVNQRNTINYSLIPKIDEDLTAWSIGGYGSISFDRLQRHLCLNITTGTIGWARVGKTRIMVNNGLSEENITIGRWRCDLSITGIGEGNASDKNIQATIRTKDNCQKTALTGWFGLDNLTLDMDHEPRCELDAWIEKNKEEVADIILPFILSPFEYKKPLVGVHASFFFGPLGSWHSLKVVLVQKFPVLVSERVQTCPI